MKAGDLVMVSDISDGFPTNRTYIYIGPHPDGGHVTYSGSGHGKCNRWMFVQPIPKPVLKPWCQDTIPEGPLVFRHAVDGKNRYLCVAVYSRGAVMGKSTTIISYNALLKGYEYFVDGQWKPCGVEVME